MASEVASQHGATTGSQHADLTWAELLLDSKQALKDGEQRAKLDQAVVHFIAQKLNDKVIAGQIESGFSAYHDAIFKSLKEHPGWGVLFDVRIYGLVDVVSGDLAGPRELVSGGPMELGMGPTKEYAAARYRGLPAYEPAPSDPKMERLDSSYLMWITVKGGKLVGQKIGFVEYRSLLKAGDEINRRFELRKLLGRELPSVLELVGAAQNFNRLADVAQQKLSDQKARAQAAQLEQARKDSIAALANAYSKLAEASAKAAQAQRGAGVTSVLQGLTSIVQAGKAANQLFDFTIDGTQLPSPAAAAQGAAATSQTDQALSNAEDAAMADYGKQQTIMINTHVEIIDFYKSQPQIPIDEIPLNAPVPADIRPDAELPGGYIVR